MAAIASFMMIYGIIWKIEINVIFNFDDEQFGLVLSRSPSVIICAIVILGTLALI